MKIKSSKALKKYNQHAILHEIINNQPITRAQLTEHLSVSHTTISYLVKDLIKQNLVIETRGDSRGGRPPKVLEFRGENKYIIVVNFEPKIIKLGLFNLNLKLIDKKRITIFKDSFKKIIDKIKKASDKILNENNIKKANIYGTGISIYKIINGEINLNDQQIKEELKDIFDYTDFYFEKETNLAVFYEWNHSLKRKYKNIIYIEVTDSIKSGMIINNKLYRGSRKKVGQLGQMINIIKNADNKHNNIYLNEYFSINTIEDEFNEMYLKGEETKIDKLFEPSFDYKKIIKAYIKEDPLSKKIIDKKLRYFLRTLFNIINLFDPQIVVLGGLFDQFNTEMIDKLTTDLKNSYYTNNNLKLQIIKRNYEKDYKLKAISSYVFEKWQENAF